MFFYLLIYLLLGCVYGKLNSNSNKSDSDLNI